MEGAGPVGLWRAHKDHRSAAFLGRAPLLTCAQRPLCRSPVPADHPSKPDLTFDLTTPASRRPGPLWPSGLVRSDGQRWAQRGEACKRRSACCFVADETQQCSGERLATRRACRPQTSLAGGARVALGSWPQAKQAKATVRQERLRNSHTHILLLVRSPHTRRSEPPRRPHYICVCVQRLIAQRDSNPKGAQREMCASRSSTRALALSALATVGTRTTHAHTHCWEFSHSVCRATHRRPVLPRHSSPPLPRSSSVSLSAA